MVLQNVPIELSTGDWLGVVMCCSVVNRMRYPMENHTLLNWLLVCCADGNGLLSE